MAKTLPGHDQETIITFNNEDEMAYIFTYDRTWQQHLEKSLGLKPVMNNRSGGKEYQLNKALISMPGVKRKPASSTVKKKSRKLSGKSVQKADNPFKAGKTRSQRENKGYSISPIKEEVVSALLRH